MKFPKASDLKAKIERQQNLRDAEKVRVNAQVSARAMAAAEAALGAAIKKMEDTLKLSVSLDSAIDTNTEAALKNLCEQAGYTWRRSWEEFGWVGGDISIK